MRLVQFILLASVLLIRTVHGVDTLRQLAEPETLDIQDYKRWKVENNRADIENVMHENSFLQIQFPPDDIHLDGDFADEVQDSARTLFGKSDIKKYHLLNNGGPHRTMQKANYASRYEADHVIPKDVFLKTEYPVKNDNPYPDDVERKHATHGTVTILVADHDRLALTGISGKNTANPRIRLKKYMERLAQEGNTRDLLLAAVAQYQFGRSDPPYKTLLQRYARGLIQAIDHDVYIGLVTLEDAEAVKSFYRLADYEKTSYNFEPGEKPEEGYTKVWDEIQKLLPKGQKQRNRIRHQPGTTPIENTMVEEILPMFQEMATEAAVGTKSPKDVLVPPKLTFEIKDGNKVLKLEQVEVAEFSIHVGSSAGTRDGCRRKRSTAAAGCPGFIKPDDDSLTNGRNNDGLDTDSDQIRQKQVAEKLDSTELSELRETLEKIQTGKDILADGVDSRKVVASPDIVTASAVSKQNVQDQEEARAQGDSSKYGNRLQYVSMVLLGKNLIKSVLAGDEQAMFIMGATVVGDVVANKVGDIITKKGSKYLYVARGLKESEKYRHLGSNGLGRLGNSLKVVGPVLAGSLSVAVGIYQLKNSVESLKKINADCNRTDLFRERFNQDCKLDKDLAIINIVESSLDVALGTVATGVGIAGAFIPVAAPVAPILIAVGIAASITASIASAVVEVAKVNNAIILSKSEKFFTMWRTFWGKGPPDYIQALVEKKAAWERLVGDQVSFLGNNSDFQVKIVPTLERKCTLEESQRNLGTCLAACWASLALCVVSKTFRNFAKCENPDEVCKHEDYYEDSEVDFRTKVQVTWDRAVPGAITKGDYLCKPEGSNGGVTVYDYKCKNALALRFPERKSKPALFELKEGADIAWGMPSDPNVFLVEHGWKHYTGGGGTDLFILVSGPARGFLDGGSGENELIIEESYLPTGIARLNLGSQAAVTVPMDPSDNGLDNLYIINVQKIEGRHELPDNVTLGCSTKEIDLKGGSLVQPDIINIAYSTFSYSLQLRLHAFTNVENRGQNGLFTYAIPTESSISVNIHTLSASCNHRFLFFDVKLKFKRKLSYLEVSSPKFTVLQTTYEHGMELFVNNGINIVFMKGRDEFVGHAEIRMKGHFFGLLYHRNNIRVKAGANIYGGSTDDVFVLSGGKGGKLDAQAGVDSLYISAEYNKNKKIVIDFQLGKVVLAENPANELWSLRSFENIVGRVGGPDRILLNCNVREVRGMGGHELDYDEIIFPRTGCKEYENENTPFVALVGQYTKIENLSPKGNFLYQMENLDSIVEVSPGSNASHTYLFSEQHSITVKEIEVDERSGVLRLQFEGGGCFNQKINPARTKLWTSDFLEISVVPEVWGLVTLEDSSKHSGRVSGLRFERNRFTISTTRNYDVEGGTSDDVFVLDGDSFQGSIHGNEGNNALVLKETFAPGRKLYLDMAEGVFTEWDNASSPMISVTDIQVFMGRANYADYVYVSCSTSSVDTMGAPSSNQSETVYIPTSNCTYNMTITLNPNQTVVNEALVGKFSYTGDFSYGFTKLSMNFKAGSISHEILFNFDYVELEGIRKLGDEYLLLTKRDGGRFQTNYWVQNELDLHSGPRMKFKDGIELKIGAFGEPGTSGFGKNVNLLETKAPPRGKRGVSEQWTASYVMAAKRTRTDLILQNGPTTLYSIGGGSKLDILTAIPDFTNFLIGNQAEQTIFRVEDGSGPVFINPGSSSSFLLDLSPVGILKPSTWIPEVRRSNQDIVLEFTNHSVTIDGGFRPDSEILIRNARLKIQCSEQNEYCSLVAPTIKIDAKETKMVFLTKRDFESGSVVQITNESELDLTPSRHGNNLVLTNLFRNHSTQDHTLSVVILDYFNIADELLEKGVNVQVGSIPVLSPLEDNLTSFESIPDFEVVAHEFHRKAQKPAVDVEGPIATTTGLPLYSLALLLFIITLVLVCSLIMSRMQRLRRQGPVQLIRYTVDLDADR